MTPARENISPEVRPLNVNEVFRGAGFLAF